MELILVPTLLNTSVFVVFESMRDVFPTIRLLESAGYIVGCAELGDDTIQYILDFRPDFLVIPHASVVIDMETMRVKYAVGESLAEMAVEMIPDIRIIFYESSGEGPRIFSRSLGGSKSIPNAAFFNLDVLRHDMGYH